jgi:hypothetical protein
MLDKQYYPYDKWLYALFQRLPRMYDRLGSIVDEAIGKLEGTLSDDQSAKVARVIEAAVIRGLLEGQHRAIDTCRECGEEEQDLAHKIATAIREKNDALIVNLSAMR